MKRSTRYRPGKSSGDRTANRFIAVVLILIGLSAILGAVVLFSGSIELLNQLGFSVMPAGLFLILLTLGASPLISPVYSFVSGKELIFVSEAEYLDYYRNGPAKVRMTIISVIILGSAIGCIAGWLLQLSVSDTCAYTAVGFIIGNVCSYLFVMHRLS